MSSAGAVPQKQDIPKELWRVATTMSDDAQNAALRKCRELGFDTNKGRISLEETFINLSQARDILVDAVEKQKLIQLPLKLQYTLLAQTEKAAQSLTALANGTDATVVLEDDVEELSASIWQFNLQNLSGEVLGLQSKINQLKVAESQIRQFAGEAAEFTVSRERAEEALSKISKIAGDAETHRVSVQASVDAIGAALTKANEQDQRVSAIAAQIEQHETTATKQITAAKQALADTENAAARSKDLQADLDLGRATLQDLTSKTQELLDGTNASIESAISDFESRYTELSTTAQNGVDSQKANLEERFDELAGAITVKSDGAVSAMTETSASLEKRITDLVSDSTNQLNEIEASHETKFADEIESFNAKSEKRLSELIADYTSEKESQAKKADETLRASDSEFKRLVQNLDELEGRIKKAIDKATGYTLFHSFQKRQLDLAKSRQRWGYLLAAMVLISLCASGAFIWSLKFVTVYNAAFYLKLSISIPLVYGIAFCNMQYSRERRLEEEYAFKSNISISLNPYRELVSQLVDNTKPEELAKYTAFVIDSVNRVFTSPTDRIFDGHPEEKTTPEKMIKALGDFLDPVLKALKKS